MEEFLTPPTAGKKANEGLEIVSTCQLFFFSTGVIISQLAAVRLSSTHQLMSLIKLCGLKQSSGVLLQDGPWFGPTLRRLGPLSCCCSS